MVKRKSCTKCKAPVKGHAGPTGKKCQLGRTPDRDRTRRKDAQPIPGPQAPETVDPVPGPRIPAVPSAAPDSQPTGKVPRGDDSNGVIVGGAPNCLGSETGACGVQGSYPALNPSHLDACRPAGGAPNCLGPETGACGVQGSYPALNPTQLDACRPVHRDIAPVDLGQDLFSNLTESQVLPAVSTMPTTADPTVTKQDYDRLVNAISALSVSLGVNMPHANSQSTATRAANHDVGDSDGHIPYMAPGTHTYTNQPITANHTSMVGGASNASVLPYGAYPRGQAINTTYPPGSVQHQLRAQGVSVKSIEGAIKGEFTDLQDYLPPIGASSHLNNELEPYTDANNFVNYRYKKHSRKITNIDSWLQAWSLYERLLVSVMGIQCHKYMSEYREFMYEANKKFLWHALSMYDYKHRLRLSSKLSLQDRVAFHIPSSDLMLVILDATAVKPNALRCVRCRGYDHVVSACPFPEQVRQGQATRPNQTGPVGNEICQNFNREKCNFGDKCRRKHVCRGCGGKQPYLKCTQSGPCKSATQA